MATFQYSARDGRGTPANGFISAASLDEAGRMLRGEGKFIIKIAAVRDAEAAAGQATPGAAAPSAGFSFGTGIRRSEVILFAQQLAVMIETGVPISEALDCASTQSANPKFQAVLKDVAVHVQGGGELSVALRRHPRVFPVVMVSLIRASEVSGTMGVMLDRVARYMAKEQQTLKQARGAMMYPCFMVLMALSVTGFLMAFVLPRFASIYESRQQVLPAPTRLLMAVSTGLSAYWYIWVPSVVAIVVTTWLFARTPAGRRTIDYLKLNAPVVKTIFLQLYIARAARTMGTMINSGVPMLDMVPVVKRVTNNIYFEELWDEVDERLRQGSQLSEPLFASKLVPRSITQMIFSGEKSGRLGQVLTRVADFTEEEFELSVKTATQFIEPVMIGVMGAIIGFVAISLLLPIFSVGKVVASG
ncbi:MAG: type II secretion system F family protein [Planctomycetota bacterium]|nr:type II secretion system F family protein [Planctomycetota bacterium]